MSTTPAGGEDLDHIRTELQRVVRRWHQLPLDHALSCAPRVRALVQSLADEAAHQAGMPPTPVPDLGPATLVDQLRVMVHELSEVGTAERRERLAGQLQALRRELP